MIGTKPYPIRWAGMSASCPYSQGEQPRGTQRHGRKPRQPRPAHPAKGIALRETLDDDPDSDDRGLLFVSYQTSIERQFEFLNNRWMGSPVNPRAPSGHDLLVGQNGQPGENRVRRCIVFGTADEPTQPPPTAEIVAEQDFVVPTGAATSSVLRSLRCAKYAQNREPMSYAKNVTSAWFPPRHVTRSPVLTQLMV